MGSCPIYSRKPIIIMTNTDRVNHIMSEIGKLSDAPRISIRDYKELLQGVIDECEMKLEAAQMDADDSDED